MKCWALLLIFKFLIELEIIYTIDIVRIANILTFFHKKTFGRLPTL